MNFDPSPRPSRLRFFAPLALAAVAAFVLFFRLGGRGLENKDTVWYVEIAWEMLRSGDWLVPRFNTVIFTEKPILFIWLVALAAKLCGAVTPLAARLPSALAALGCVALTVSIGRKALGSRTGLLAGFILATSYAFAWEARTCMVDMTFTLFTTLSLAFLYDGYRSGGRGAREVFLLAYVAAGLAALTKGPLGLVIPALVFLCYLAARRRLGMLRGMMIPWGILIVLGIQAAWYVPYLVRIGPEGRRFFVDMYIYKENLLRFTSGFDKTEPFWFYVPEFFAHFLPWSPFLLLLPFLPKPSRGGEADRTFSAVWFFGIFAFLTLSSGKHSRYALPLYPAAAIMAADSWNRLLEAGDSKVSRVVSLVIAAAGAAAALAYPFAAWKISPGFIPAAILLSAVLLGVSAMIARASGPRRAALAFGALVYAFACAWSVFLMGFPAKEEHRADHRRLAESVAPATNGEPLATFGPTEERFGRRLALGYYLGSPVEYIDGEPRLLDYLGSTERVWCLMETPVFEELGARLPAGAAVRGHHRYRDLDLVLVSNGRGGGTR